VDADIETQIAVSPAASHFIVYNAPNDFSGQTELDEYTAIANADQAASISSSWAVCERDVTAAYVQAENPRAVPAQPHSPEPVLPRHHRNRADH
jgi:hypothetical protein